MGDVEHPYQHPYPLASIVSNRVDGHKMTKTAPKRQADRAVVGRNSFNATLWARRGRNIGVMNGDPAKLLGAISGGRVLDVATGAGGFVHSLVGGLKDWTEIIGIDTDGTNAEEFAEAFAGVPRVRFETMHALDPSYPAASFDTASIANSLHHFPSAPAVLACMRRLVRTGGALIVSEMYRDHQTPAQVTHVQLHHWCAEVDRLAGIVHRRTYRRAQLASLLVQLALKGLRVVDVSETFEDPKEPATVDVLDGVIDRYLERATGHAELQARGEAVRRRLHAVGAHGASTLLAVGRKP